MSCVVWDGRQLAADRKLTCNNICESTTKLHPHGDVVLAWTGDLAAGLAVINWYLQGADPDRWPACQRNPDTRATLIVASTVHGQVSVYFGEPFAMRVEDDFAAWGSGREVALGALAMGASAGKAVEIASRFDICSGLGVDVIDIKSEEKP